jgi:hypothetical protein
LAHELWGDIEVTRFFGGPFSSEEIDQRLEREIARMRRCKVVCTSISEEVIE